MKIENGFKLSKEASKFSDYNKKNIHIGSVIMYKNRPISIGWNTNKTNPMQYHYNKYREADNNRDYVADSHLPCIHAEMMALINSRDVNIDWSKCHIFVYRKGMCRPCPICMKAISDRGIKHIWYTNSKGEYMYEEI